MSGWRMKKGVVICGSRGCEVGVWVRKMRREIQRGEVWGGSFSSPRISVVSASLQNSPQLSGDGVREGDVSEVR